jgi:hypothetical protein
VFTAVRFVFYSEAGGEARWLRLIRQMTAVAAPTNATSANPISHGRV